MFRAMRLVVPEDQAREMARHWASLPDQIERGDAIGWGLADGTYIVLSLLGGETAKRVEKLYVSRLSREARARFEQQLGAIRARLEDEGRL